MRVQAAAEIVGMQRRCPPVAQFVTEPPARETEPLSVHENDSAAGVGHPDHHRRIAKRTGETCVHRRASTAGGQLGKADHADIVTGSGRGQTQN